MKMKKLAVLLLAGALTFATLTGCSDDAAPEAETEQEVEVEEEELEDEEEVELEEEEVEEEAEVFEVPAYIANATDADFVEIYLSVSGNDEWGEDLLGADEYLPSGHILPITLQLADADGVVWDLRVVDPNGDALEWYDLDISQMPVDGFAIELMWDGETGTAKLAETPDQLEGEYVTE